MEPAGSGPGTQVLEEGRGPVLGYELELPGPGQIRGGKWQHLCPLPTPNLDPTDLITLIATCTNYLCGARWLGGGCSTFGR